MHRGKSLYLTYYHHRMNNVQFSVHLAHNSLFYDYPSCCLPSLLIKIIQSYVVMVNNKVCCPPNFQAKLRNYEACLTRSKGKEGKERKENGGGRWGSYLE